MAIYEDNKFQMRNTVNATLAQAPRNQMLSAGPADGALTNCVNMPIERTKNGRISLISMEDRFGSCEKHTFKQWNGAKEWR
jgi:hypothetical protein